ncbi:hypothetical protein BDV96DRAFT_114031 [Lophiotrema nucula]|uniref:Uncharacterized protein n=1 Tax=Lophiotrema nucula TaxID=690887 RepID=A0A6A5Z561_9PLEO|nr:hypothetical protein BDV96DRAFT_114031 [Lophiotrema nucula]
MFLVVKRLARQPRSRVDKECRSQQLGASSRNDKPRTERWLGGGFDVEEAWPSRSSSSRTPCCRGLRDQSLRFAGQRQAVTRAPLRGVRPRGVEESSFEQLRFQQGESATTSRMRSYCFGCRRSTVEDVPPCPRAGDGTEPTIRSMHSASRRKTQRGRCHRAG